MKKSTHNAVLVFLLIMLAVFTLISIGVRIGMNQQCIETGSGARP